MKTLITGFPGTGKSTIARELKRLGYMVVDPEEIPGYMHTESIETGERIAKPAIVPRGWYDTVGAYNWDRDKLARLLAQKGTLFVCSMAHNQADYYDRFDTLIVLTIDDSELERRLKQRAGQTLGKHPDELYDILRLHNAFEQKLCQRGAIPIDAGAPLEDVIDTIIDSSEVKR